MACEILLFKKLSKNAYTPTRGTSVSVGFDLRSAYHYEIPPYGKLLVSTDIQISLPAGTYGRIAPRSGLAINNFIDVGGGVIDADYRGNIRVILFNFGKEIFKISPGDRIAQLL